MPPLDLDSKFLRRSCRGFRSLWAMFDLADSLIGKANQIEESCHISFFSEFKKKPALPSDKNRQSRLALNSPFHFPLRKTPCVPPVWPHITWKPSRWWGEALLRVHKYHFAKSCQDYITQHSIER